MGEYLTLPLFSSPLPPWLQCQPSMMPVGVEVHLPTEKVTIQQNFNYTVLMALGNLTKRRRVKNTTTSRKKRFNEQNTGSARRYTVKDISLPSS